MSAEVRVVSNPASRRMPAVLMFVALLQLAICTWLVIDLVQDHGLQAWRSAGVGEFLASVALLLCTGAVLLACRAEHRRLARMEEQMLALTSGLVVMVGQSFIAWDLTRAESDVALMALKGFETNEIADMRHASASTVRAQLARVYAKAGVESRAGLQGLFLEDLMSGLPMDSLALETARSGMTPG